ncbi:protein cycle [Strongylocentrotus purpuratus]|uniref:Aryl hydrocarbon receptor nuclear translocator-like protein 1 n=1 Tax=Strongylocentrotus purpuratus TaxID=7668 RepID=A0A7M7P2F7_STRPU|nr:protein cycle [Strongylocentrotus purpuratus]
MSISSMSSSMDRKRKLSFIDSGGEDMSDEDLSSERNTSGDDSKKLSKQNHSEIEKRRREKMNTYIQELSAMVPTCSSMSSKLDKLTILRMAVQHMKTLRGASSSRKEANYKPSFLSEDDLNPLILEAAEGFLFVVSCDRGRVLYVSESVLNVLNITWERLIGQSLFDILHPKDIPKVKEQLSSSDLSPRERFIDTKTGMLVKSEMTMSPPQLSSGARRSFFCRMRIYSPEHAVKTEDGQQWKRLKQPADRKKYATIHCTGYLKSWPPGKVGLDKDEMEVDIDGCNLSCLVAVARVQTIQSPMLSTNNNIQLKPIEFVSRHAMDGKYTFVDQRATAVMGYLPQELLGTSCYEYYHIDDISSMAEYHKTVLSSKEKILTTSYRFRAKNGDFILLRSRMFTFRNPWTKEIEYVVSTNTLVNKDEAVASNSNECGPTTKDQDSSQLQSLITNLSKSAAIPGVATNNTHMGAGKIGWKIAEEVIEAERVNEVTSSGWESKDASPVVVDSLGITGEAVSSIGSDSNKGSSREVHSSSSNPKPDKLPPAIVMTGQSFLNSALVCGDQTGSSGNLPQNPFAEMSSAAGLSTAALAAELSTPGAAAAAAAKVKEMGGDDEAAMAFIMSLLEADAGLGGSVDFNDLPWPL